MSFTTADLVSTIRLGGIDTASRDLEGFKQRLENVDTRASKLGKTAESTFRATATSIGVASTAAAVYLTKLMATGVEYNTLQQTSRAALKTIRGGAEQANAQMDRLDAFAKKSPFSKSVFITAQQQLLGFGVEARKVVPALDAIQNAVAAVGGSNEQISQIAYTLAQMRGQGKLTGDTLTRLGLQGIDAAEIIAEKMGKTSAEIREMASKPGGIPADEVWDPLVDGLSEKFDGAAANVKETYAGTVDRIRAASRDIGAALAEPFVSKDGGGLYVTWGNQVADVMRAVEGHVAPVVSILTGRAAPAFAKLTEFLDKTTVRVKAWDSSKLEKGLDAVAGHGPGVAAAAGAVLAMNAQLLNGIPVLGRFIPAIHPLAGAIAAAAVASPELRTELAGLLAELKPLLSVAGEIAVVLSGALASALPVVATGVRGVSDVARPFVDILGKIPSPMLAAVVAGLGFNSMLGKARPALQRFAEQMAVQQGIARATGGSLDVAGRQVGNMGAAFAVARTKISGVGLALKGAFLSNPIGMTILGVSTAAAILTTVFAAQAQVAQETRERVEGYRTTLNETTGAITDATRAQIDKNIADGDTADHLKRLDIARETYIRSLMGEEDAVRRVQEALEAADEVRESVSDRRGLDYDSRKLVESASAIRENYEAQSSAIRTAVEDKRADAQASREAAEAMSDAARSNTRFNEALKIARETGRDATERLRALKLALDELNGGTRTQEQLQRDLAEHTLNLADAFAVTDESGEKLADSLVKANGEVNKSTREGLQLETQIARLNDQMLEAIRTTIDYEKENDNLAGAFDAGVAAGKEYPEMLRQIALEAGLSEEKTEALIAMMMDVPEIIAFMYDDGGTYDTKMREGLALAAQILTTPDGEFTVSSDSFPGLKRALEALGIDITSLPTGTVKVQKDDGSFVTVEEYLSGLTRTRYVSIVGIADSTASSSGPPRLAGGGAVRGAGSDMSDSVHALLSNNEHVWTAAETRGAGGHGVVARMRALAKSGMLPTFAAGGPVLGVQTAALPAPALLQVASPTSRRSHDDQLSELIAEVRSLRSELGRPNVSLVNPVSRDPMADAWEAAQILGTHPH
ncbi:tape measure protein [Microbacterium sp. YY-01]|uniref:tape measure protein n=1 Tax=Microbacterium sp. YY-01 TaxID=3421634 RepID=UPI003D177EEE